MMKEVLGLKKENKLSKYKTQVYETRRSNEIKGKDIAKGIEIEEER